MKCYELTVYMYIVIFLVLYCVLKHFIAVIKYMNYYIYVLDKYQM